EVLGEGASLSIEVEEEEALAISGGSRFVVIMEVDIALVVATASAHRNNGELEKISMVLAASTNVRLRLSSFVVELVRMRFLLAFSHLTCSEQVIFSILQLGKTFDKTLFSKLIDGAEV
ncbi:hypothetical protein Tco_0576758, partial [Tanacetum coccineum]